MIHEAIIMKNDIQKAITMRNWFLRLRKRAAMSDKSSTPSIADIQGEYPGLFVALKNGEVVEAATTPYALIAALHTRGISNSTIIRVPDPQEPELVGWG
jgi:hypothetical protein